LSPNRHRLSGKEQAQAICRNCFFKEKGFHLSAKTITRILKERGIKNPFTHKGPKKHRRREQKKQFEKIVQIDASPFDWLCNGSMLSLHGAIDDATEKILALWLKPTECLF